VIYSQRIADTDGIMTCTAADVHKMHQPSGAIIQLLAINIDPQAQDAGYGDQLLEFMLQRCGLMTGIEQVVGVTLCKNYDSTGIQSFAQYIQRQDGSQDPVLAFHYAHGAEIVTAVPGYRPQDHSNLSNGVLVVYDILNRTPRRGRQTMETTTTSDADLAIGERQISQFVQAQAASLLGINRSVLDIDRPLMEMGMDSADLLQLQRQVEDRFCLKLQAGFFFEHNNIRKVIRYLTTRLAATPDANLANSLKTSEIQRPCNNEPPESSNKEDQNRISTTDIAIVGMSCKLPGGIETPGQLWQVLAAKKSAGVYDGPEFIGRRWRSG